MYKLLVKWLGSLGSYLANVSFQRALLIERNVSFQGALLIVVLLSVPLHMCLLFLAYIDKNNLH